MDPNDAAIIAAWAGVVVAFIAAVAAFIALIPAKRAADAAKDQTELQRQIAQESAAPTVWADIRPFLAGLSTELVIGNSGHTVATHVRVEVNPPLPVRSNDGDSNLSEVQLSSLAPGRELRFFLFASNEWDSIMPGGGSAHRITIKANGPYGVLAPVEFTLDLAEYRETIVTTDGAIRDIVRAIDRLDKSVNHGTLKVNASVQKEVQVVIARGKHGQARKRPSRYGSTWNR